MAVPPGGPSESGISGLARVFPDLEEDLLLQLFHKGAKVQWTSVDFDWASPLVLSDRQRLALARLLTPVYFGEQSAMVGAGAIMPRVMSAGETTAQLYLASFIMDEARHFEALTRVYRALGHDPLTLRELPELMRYHHRIRQGDRADWVWGILFSDVIAKHFYRSFGASQSDPLFAGLSARILQDESRHLAFAEHYLRRNVARMDRDRRRAMLDMRDDLFRLLRAMTDRVRRDSDAFGVDGDAYLSRVWADVEMFAKRIGLAEALADPPPPPADGMDHPSDRHPQASGTVRTEPASGAVRGERMVSLSNHEPQRPRPDEPRFTSDASANVSPVATPPVDANGRALMPLPECFGCLLALICGRRLAPA